MRTALLIALLLTSPALGREKPTPDRDRIVWQRDDLVPLPEAGLVRLRALTTAHDGATLFTRVYQFADLWKRRLEDVVYETKGEELTGASVNDMNDDGVKEVLLRFAPPKQQSLVHIVVLCFSRRDKRYIKILDVGPSTGLSARWFDLVKTRELHEIGLAIDSPGGTLSYRYEGEMLHPFAGK